MKFTYLFYCVATGLTKIGKTRFPLTRFKALGGKSRLVVVGLIEGDSEKEMHKKHHAERAHGEWFRLSGAQLRGYIRLHPVKELPVGNHPKVPSSPPETSRTRHIFDLYDELTAEEIARFEFAAAEAKAPNLTEFFLNIAPGMKSRSAA